MRHPGTFREWARAQGAPGVRAAFAPEIRLGAASLIATLAAIASLAPVVRHAFELSFVHALAGFVPVILLTAAHARVANAGRVSLVAAAAWMLATSAVLEMYFAYLAALSRGPGKAVFAALFVLAAASHGHLLRVSARCPFALVGTSLGALLALAFHRSPDHLAVFGLAIPLAIGSSLLAGSVARRTDALEAAAEQLRHDETAQQIAAHRGEADRLASALVEVLGRDHDIHNALAVARLNADLLEARLESGAAPPPAGELREMVIDIRDSLDRVKSIYAVTRKSGGSSDLATWHIEAVDAVGVGQAIVEAARKRFRDTDVELIVDGDPHAARATARVRGGRVSLERVVENLLVNACEGDGTRAARHAVLRIGADAEGAVTMSVSDDGPGFDPSQLARDIGGFVTTKATGTGLGLCTAERIVRASGGVITRANGPTGGAVVTVKLARGDIG